MTTCMAPVGGKDICDVKDQMGRFARHFYRCVLERLRWLRERKRDPVRSAEFWSRARARVLSHSWVKGHARWFDRGEEKAIFHVQLEFKASRAAENAGALDWCTDSLP